MHIDIDTDSVIHKHLVKKLDDLDESSLCTGGQLYYHRHQILKLKSNDYKGYYARADHYYKPDDVKHNLTMLDSFHISLGTPFRFNSLQSDPTVAHDLYEEKLNESLDLCHMDAVPIIGDITLAPIYISAVDNKKSAWIPLHPEWIYRATHLWGDINLDLFDSYDHLGKEDEDFPIRLLHVSIANLTGNPYDSIARPENCIIDTIHI